MKAWVKRRLCVSLLLSYVLLHVKPSYESSEEEREDGEALLITWRPRVDALWRRRKRRRNRLMAASRTRDAIATTRCELRCVASLVFVWLVKAGDVELNPGPKDKPAPLSIKDHQRLCKAVSEAAAKWRALGRKLGFTHDELGDVTRCPGLKEDKDYMDELLSRWLKWAPPNHLFPCVEGLATALRSKSVGEERTAYDMMQMIKSADVSWCEGESTEDIIDAPPPAKRIRNRDTYREKGVEWSCDPTHLATHQAIAATSQTDSIAVFAKEQKELYSKLDSIPDEDWPPSIGRYESNLVMIEHGRDTLPGAEEAEKMQRDYVRGNVDRIAERKKEIRYENIFDFRATVDNSKNVSFDSKHFRMLIDGAPGVGKTTLCRKFCKDWGAGQILKQFSIVWLLNLREERIAKAKSLDDLLKHYDEDLLREVVQHIKKTGGEGNLLVFDGFDEMSKKERTQNSLFLDIIRGRELPKCSVLVSSRPYASQMLQQIKSITHHVEIVGFTEEQMKECIRRNITDKPKAEELIKQLKQRLDVLSLCYTPLNAAIMLYVYKQEQFTLPTTLTQLYTLYILHSLKRSVEIHFENFYSDDISDLKNLPGSIALPFKALCKMAYNGLLDDQMGFSTSQLPQSLQGCPGCKGTKPDLLGLMSGSKSFTGSNAEVSYQFIHLTAQEFLAAWYVDLVLSAEEQGKLFVEKAGDDRFIMMLLFLAGITGLQDTHVYKQILLKSYHQLQEEELKRLQKLEKSLQVLQQEPCGILLQRFIDIVQPYQIDDREQIQDEPQLFFTEQEQGESRQITKLAKRLKENIFLLHLIYESQNTSLSPILAQVLASAVHQDVKLEFKFNYCDLFECTVVAYFLSTCNFPWKHLELACVTDEQMEVIYRVCCEHAGSSDVRGAQNTNAANPQFLKDTQKLSLHLVFDGSTPPQKPTSFSYLHNMKLMSLVVFFENFTMHSKYCSILFNVLTHHKTLQRLEIMIEEIDDFDTKEYENLQEMLKTNTSLQYLEISCNEIGDLTTQHIAAGLVHNHSLKELDISGNNITSVGATSIFRALVNNTTLESLNLSRNNLQSTPNSPSLPTSSNNTSSLSPPSQLLAQPTPAFSTIHCQPLSPSPAPHDGSVGAAMADILSHNSTLTELNVSECSLTPQSCASMFKALKHNSSLKKLIIGNKSWLYHRNRFDLAASYALTDMLSHNSTLTELDVSLCGLTPQFCVSMFKAMKHNSLLNKLDISGTTFDQAASEALADMLSCNHLLTELIICGCACQPKALARGLLYNTTLTNVTIWYFDYYSIMEALVNLRRGEGHTQQPDPEVARCEQVLQFFGTHSAMY